jgi:ATP-binding cassette subfamily B multidrug efflux pump
LHPVLKKESKDKSQFSWVGLKRVIAYAHPYTFRFYISILLALVLAALAPVRPWLINQTVNEYIGNNMPEMLIRITLFQIALLVIETLLRFVFSYYTAWIGQRVVKDLRTQVFDKILHYNLRQFDRTPIGTLTTRTVNDIETISDIFAEGFIPILGDLLTIVSVLITMFVLNWKLTLICLIPFPVLLVGTYFFKESVNRSFRRVRNAVAALNAFVQEHIQGMQVVQAFSAETRESDKFREINKEHREANIHAIFAYSVFFPFVEIILAISLGLLVWFGALQSLDAGEWEARKMAGEVMAFILLLNMLFRPLRFLADKFNVLQMGVVASERVFKVIDLKDELMPPSNGYDPSFAFKKGEITFRNVWFAYENEAWVLKDLSFTAQAGKTLALVGATGSGKTTVISLLNRLYEVQKGNVLIDGTDVTSINPELLRNGIGVVLQDVFLFDGTIRENVTLGNPAITEEQLKEAAQMLGVDQFVSRLPGGYDYQVMERGATLSQGQRQLLSFLRTLLYNPVILVLDEATASVDPDTEKLIQHAIEKLIEGRTSIVIAHRLSTIRKADQILVMEKGCIKESGTHNQLIEANEAYARLYAMQFSDT